MTWALVGFAITFALIALSVTFGMLNGPIKSLVERRLSGALGAQVTAEGLEGNPFFEFSLTRVEISGSDRVGFACGEVFISYRPIGLLWGSIVVDSLRFVSPRLRLKHADEGGSEFRADELRGLPPVELQSIVVQHGIMAIDRQASDPTIADNLNLEMGFSNIEGDVALRVRQFETILLDPPVEVTNLSGLALSREDVLLLRDVQVSSPRSSMVLNGEIVGLTSPFFRFDVAVDSLNLAEVDHFLEMGLPPAVLWLSGKIEGSVQAFDIDLDWVAGGAAGDLEVRVGANGPRTHSVRMQGREVDLNVLTGVPARGDFHLIADGDGLSVSEAVGQARASVTNGLLYGVSADSLTAELRYSDSGVSGSVWLDGDVGKLQGTIVSDPEQRVVLNGRLFGVDLEQVGGPATELDGSVLVERFDGESRIQAGLSKVVIEGRDLGTIAAELSQTSDYLTLDSMVWDGPGQMFDLSGLGDLWRKSGHRFDVRFAGSVAPFKILDVPDTTVTTVELGARIWSESLKFGATRERLELSGDLRGLLGLDSLNVEATAEGGRVVLDRFGGVGPEASLQVVGELILDSAFDLQATYVSADLSGVPRILKAGATGSAVQTTVTVVGPWDSPEILARSTADRIDVLGATFEGMRLEANLPVRGEGGASLHAATVAWGGRSLAGFYADVGRTGQEVSFLVGNKEGSENRVSLWGSAIVSGDSIDARLDSARIQLQEEYVVNRGHIILSHTPGRGLVVKQLSLVGPTGELESVPHARDAINIRVNDFDLAPWAFLVGKDDEIEGTLSGGVSIEGQVGSLKTVAAFKVGGARIGSFCADTVHCDVSYQGDHVSGKLGVEISTGTAYLEGNVGTDTSDPEREIDLRFVSEAVPLRALNDIWPQITEIDGELSGQVWMTGPARAVEMTGDLVASSGEFQIPSLKRGLKKVTLEVDISPVALTFSQFDGEGLAGALAATGTIDLLGFNVDRVTQDPLFGPLNLDMIATGLDASGTEDIKAIIDGTVKLTGTLDQPSLAGTLALQKAEIRLLSMLEAPPDPESIWRAIPFFRNLECELQVSADRQLWVRDEAVNVELSGDLDVLRALDGKEDLRQEELGFRFFGTMNSLRGTYRFQNRTFRVWRDGELRFLGDRVADPEIDLRAWSRFPILTPTGTDGTSDRTDIDMTIMVLGSFARPVVSLVEGHPGDANLVANSDEASQAELLSYILFGRSADQLIAAEQSVLGDQSAGLVLGLATRELQSRIAESLDLDMVQVEMGTGSSIDRVRVGKYINDKLFVTYEDQIGQGREFSVEYELLPRFSLESSFGESPDGQVLPSLQLTWGKDW